MRRTVIALAALSILAGCAVIVVPDGEGGVHYKSAFSGDAVQGNGQNVTETRQVAALDAIDVNGPMQVEIRVGQATSLQVEGDSNILPLLRTDASSGTLRVWVDGNVRTSHPLRVTYSTPALRQVDSNGSGAMNISGLSGGPLSMALNGSRAVRVNGYVSNLDVRMNGSGGLNASGLDSSTIAARVSGSGRLTLGRVNGDQLNLELNGSGGANASGSVRSMTVRTNGSGSADLASLTSQTAELNTNGSGSISAAVTQSVVAAANGSGRVTVYGNPSQRNVSGKHVSFVQ